MPMPLVSLGIGGIGIVTALIYTVENIDRYGNLKYIFQTDGIV